MMLRRFVYRAVPYNKPSSLHAMSTQAMSFMPNAAGESLKKFGRDLTEIARAGRMTKYFSDIFPTVY